jgi:signal transduction histidine kinase/CheY-like chemotaxis protein
MKSRIAPREGLIGQAAADKRVLVLNNVPPDFVRISSGLGEARPASVIILPALFEDDVKAVIELASFGEFSDTHQSFLNQLMESVGIVLNTIAATMRTEGLLKQSQLLTAELQARQAELTTKQGELHATNEELQEKAQLLELEKKQVENKNLEIEMARRALEEKAEQLALTSKYKSEFLANMSHELRTPLNSLLILSKLLASNQTGNLDEKQVEFARTINSAGTDLLSLINDILDLSKIESGTVTIELGEMPIAQMRQHMERTFRQLAADKGLVYHIHVDPALPETIRTDEKRLQQVVLNLLSNAFKFTTEGEVTLDISLVGSPLSGGVRRQGPSLAIAVTDTGIGIPEDKQKLIFEAFQQADGTTSRKYGGTGLGLSISREIARLLGGELGVQSAPGRGSTFTLTIPIEALATAADPSLPRAAVAEGSTDSATLLDVVDDRESIGPNDRVVMIVEDDPTFGAILVRLAREAGLKAVLSTAGAGTLALARRFVPDAITLDLGLSDIDGWVLFDLLRHDPKTRLIPIHVVSGNEEVAALTAKGAATVWTKPVEPEVLSRIFGEMRAKGPRAQRSVLLVDGDPDRRLSMVSVLRDGITAVVALGAPPVEGVGQHDVIVAGLGRSQADNLRLLDALPKGRLVLFGETSDAVEQVRAARPDLAVEGRAQTTSQLGQVVASILAGGATAPIEAPTDVADLRGARVLVVDDDIRNIFSLTSVLETVGIEVLHAERGMEGIRILEATPEVDAALIDIMMPDMDGYETMREIRRRPQLRELPLISVTAKAMKGDRAKCLEAGASDYIAKPVDLDLLLALLRVWIGRSRSRRGAEEAPVAQPVPA